MMQLPNVKPLDASALHTQVAALVPSMNSLSIRDDHVEFRNTSGTFSAAEIVLIQQALDAHDFQAIEQQRQQRETRKQAAPQAIKQATSIPALRQAVMDFHGIS